MLPYYVELLNVEAQENALWGYLSLASAHLCMEIAIVFHRVTLLKERS